MNSTHFCALRVWRLVPPMGVFSEAMKQAAAFDGRWHRVATRVVYAYESPELAAQLLGYKVGAHVPKTLLQECIELPMLTDAHERISGDQARAIMTGQAQHEGLRFQDVTHYMQKMRRLSVWIPMAEAGRQHVVLLNPAHVAMPETRVSTRMVDFSPPRQVGMKRSVTQPRATSDRP